jgi:hypothetical protein
VGIETLQPSFKITLETGVFKDTVPSTAHAKGAAAAIHEGRHHGTLSSEIDEILANQDTVDLCIDGDVLVMSMTSPIRVKGIALLPRPSGVGAVINIIATALLATSTSIGLFEGEARVSIVLIKAHGFSDTHGIYQVSTATYLAITTAVTHNPVA